MYAHSSLGFYDRCFFFAITKILNNLYKITKILNANTQDVYSLSGYFGYPKWSFVVKIKHMPL